MGGIALKAGFSGRKQKRTMPEPSPTARGRVRTSCLPSATGPLPTRFAHFPDCRRRTFQLIGGNLFGGRGGIKAHGGTFRERIEKGARGVVSVRIPFLLAVVVGQPDKILGAETVAAAENDANRIAVSIRTPKSRSPEIPEREADAS